MIDRYPRTPLGVILHGSRSGKPQSTLAEFRGTASYALTTPYAWHATVGSDMVALHMAFSHWGWHARGCSSRYIGVEFAQPTVQDEIDDGQVRAFCWTFLEARKTWPDLPRHFPSHADVDGSALYGPLDGKSDVFPAADPRLLALRRRILDTLDAWGVK